MMKTLKMVIAGQESPALVVEAGVRDRHRAQEPMADCREVLLAALTEELVLDCLE